MPTSSEANNPERAARISGGSSTPTVHVIIVDGTMSTLADGLETNAGLAFKLISETGSPVSVHYERGLQWPSLRRASLRLALGVLMGRGINPHIGPAVSAAGFQRTLVESKPFSRRVRIERRGMPDKRAEVVETGL